MSKDTTAVVPVKTEPQALAVNVPIMAPAQLKAALEVYSESRKILMAWIVEQLSEDVDFGHIKGGSGQQVTRRKMLFRPGAEKICTLMQSRPVLSRDNDTWESLGKPTGVVCVKCEIVRNSDDKIIGMGSGACKLGEKASVSAPHNCIAVAEKRAISNAVRRTFGLSDVFDDERDDGHEKRGEQPPAPGSQEGSNQQIVEAANDLFKDYEQALASFESVDADKPAVKLLADKEWRRDAKGKFSAWAASILGITVEQAGRIDSWTMESIAKCKAWLKMHGTDKRGDEQEELGL